MRCLSVLVFMIPLLTFAQSGPSRRASRSVEKGDLAKALTLVNKALEKDSSDVLAWYQFSKILFLQDSSKIQLDSAHTTLLKGKEFYSCTTDEDKEKYLRQGIDTYSLEFLEDQIDSAAFKRVSTILSEASFNDFLTNYPMADRREEAIKIRDSLAYKFAGDENTYQAYRHFMSEYPDAIQYSEASKRFEKLYFEVATRDGTLLSFAGFLRENPSTPYRKMAEQNILEIISVLNDPESIINFIRLYPESTLISRARAFLFYSLDNKEDMARIYPNQLNDSLSNILSLNESSWYPFLQNNRYGFMDTSGTIRIKPTWSNMPEEYFCKGLKTDYFITDGGVFSRNGTNLLHGKTDEIYDTGSGILIYRKHKNWGAIHKSGNNLLLPQMDSIILLGKKFLAYSFKGKWGLNTLTGRKLLDPLFDDIFYDRNMVFLEKNNYLQPLTLDDIKRLANNEPVEMTFTYDKYHFFGDHLWMGNDHEEIITDHTLKPLIPSGEYKIESLTGIYLIRSPEKTEWITKDLLQKYESNETLLGYNLRYALMKRIEGVGLFDMNRFAFVALSDSAVLVGKHFAICFTGTTAKLYLQNSEPLPLSSNPEIQQLISSANSEYLVLKSGRQSLVYDTGGNVLMQGVFENISCYADSLLVYSRKGKKGLINAKGENLLDPVYDAIGNFDGELLAILKDGQIGAYEVDDRKIIRAVSSKRLRKLNTDQYLGEKDGQMGISDSNGKKLVPYKFDQIHYWNDTTCLVKNDTQWRFYHIGSGFTPDSPMRSVQFVKENRNDQEIIILTDSLFSVLNNNRGEVLPAKFSDIINIGSSENPIFLTETPLEGSAQYLISYFNGDGELIHQQFMVEDQMEKLFCY